MDFTSPEHDARNCGDLQNERRELITPVRGIHLSGAGEP
jgi:hypothetical protein